MPVFAAPVLESFAAQLLVGGGLAQDEAALVARSLVGADLRGHDSHGVMRITQYVDQIAKREVIPGASYTILRESETIVAADGHWGFGFYVNARAMELTIEKAKKTNVAACTVFRQSHVGQVGGSWYPK